MGEWLRARLPQILCLVALSACAPLSLSGSSAGVCETADGNVVDTYQLVGKWKKKSPYSPSRTSEELETNYELLIIVGGVQLNTVRAPMCLANVVNTGLSTVPYRALYEHDVSKKEIYIEYTQGEGAGTTADVKYSFSGSCGETQLHLDYGSTTEVYEIYGTSDTVNSDDCNPQ